MEVDNPPKRELEVEQKSSVSCSERWSRKGGVTSTPWKVWEIDPNLPIWYRETPFTPITVLASSPRWSRRFGHHPGGVQGDPSWFSRVKTLAMRVELRRLLGMLYILVRCTPAEGAPWARAFPAHQGERKPGEHHPCVAPSQAGRRFGEAKSGPMDLFRKKNASHTEQTQEKQEKEQKEEEAAPRNHLVPRCHSGSASASACPFFFCSPSSLASSAGFWPTCSEAAFCSHFATFF